MMDKRHVIFCVFFFFKQKTAYEMRISDWSSDVCSSDLCAQEDLGFGFAGYRTGHMKGVADLGDLEPAGVAFASVRIARIVRAASSVRAIWLWGPVSTIWPGDCPRFRNSSASSFFSFGNLPRESNGTSTR